ncbi:MAG: PLAT/LH2 domain-containing protein [Bacillota bacterium]
MKKTTFKKLTGLLVISFILTAFYFGGVFSAWSSSGGTHTYIVDTALNILQNDKPDIIYDYDFQMLLTYIEELREGSIAPDDLSKVLLGGLLENDWWASHFYDPDLNQTYGTAKTIHAEFQTRRFLNMAVVAWKQADYSKAAYLLGYAMHFYGDLNNPNHAANNTLLDSPYNHEDFEAYIAERNSSYLAISAATAADSASEVYAASVNNNNNFPEFITAKCKADAKHAKGYFNTYIKYYTEDVPGYQTYWDKTAKATVENAQKGTAVMIYRFLQEVKTVDEIRVTIHTGDELWAGTDDDIFFGFETMDGTKREFLLDDMGDIASGVYSINTVNDFERNDYNAYRIYFKDKRVDYSKVKRIWIRKYSPTSSSGDNWLLGALNVHVNGSEVFSSSPNRWFKNMKDNSYSMYVDGLVPPQQPVGWCSVTIDTADIDYSGTDDYVYFGIKMANGEYYEHYCDTADYNDFERNTSNTYWFYIDDPSFQPERVARIWLHKYSEVYDDDAWYPARVELNMGGKKFSRSVNKWLESYNTGSYDVYHNIYLNGL